MNVNLACLFIDSFLRTNAWNFSDFSHFFVMNNTNYGIIIENWLIFGTLKKKLFFNDKLSNV